MVGRARFERATNWLKAKGSTPFIFMFLLNISEQLSPHSYHFFYSFTFESISFYVLCMVFVGNFFSLQTHEGFEP